MSDLVFGPAARPWEETSAKLSELLDAGIVAERAKDTPRDYLGMSRLGEECMRKLAYEFTHTPKDPGREFPGRTLRIFQRGHDCEARVAAYLRYAGFELLTETPSGKQFGAYIAKDPETGRARIAGHTDGVITGCVNILGSVEAQAWMAALPYPMLWENKGVNSKNFKKYQAGGIKKGNNVYYAQMQLYMAYLELHWALFTAENQDTCEIFAELVPFNAKDAQEASDRGVVVVSARDPEELPRITNDPADFRCKWCDYPQRCWSAPAANNGQPTTAAPSWLPKNPG